MLFCSLIDRRVHGRFWLVLQLLHVFSVGTLEPGSLSALAHTDDDCSDTCQDDNNWQGNEDEYYKPKVLVDWLVVWWSVALAVVIVLACAFIATA